MNREEFAVRWMDGNGFITKDGTWINSQKWCLELLGTIYDLQQQQISELQEKCDELV